jgi:drug/metabolite transporter (DMT)-like permease
LIGIALMVLTVFLFVCMDTLAKHLTQSYTVTQVLWARYAFALGLVVALLRGRLPGLARSGRPGLQIARGLLLLLSSMLFFTAISLMPLADAMTIGFVGPLLLAALAVPVLGETVPARRWIAIAVAFAGVVVVIRPGLGVFQWWSLLPLGTACCFAAFQLITRLLGRVDRPETTMIWTTTLACLAVTLAVPTVWRWPEPADWALMAVMGLIGGGSHWLLIEAFRRAPASLLAPFSYTQLPWAMLFGWLVFGDLPDIWTLAGAAIIVGSGLYVLLDERRGAALTR